MATELNVGKSVVGRVWKRFNETGIYTRRPGQGRKRKTPATESQYGVTCAIRRRSATARDQKNYLRAATGARVSDQTIRTRLREVDIRSRRPNKVPRLQQHHKVNRLRFAHEHRIWQLRHWRNVLVSWLQTNLTFA